MIKSSVHAYIYILLIIAIFIIGIIVYAIIYNKNANKVLKTGKPNVLLDKGPFINMLALFGILILCVVMLIQNTNLKRLIKNYADQVVSLQSDITYLKNQNTILGSRLNELVDGQKNVYNFDYEIKELDVDKKKVDVVISFSLREALKNSTITIKAIRDNLLSETVQVVATGTGVYSGTLKLAIDGDYSIILIEETDEIIKTYQAGNVYLKGRFQLDFKATILFKPDGKYELQIVIDKNNLIDALRPTDVVLLIKDKFDSEILNKSIFSSLKGEAYGYSYIISDNIKEEDINLAQIDIFYQLGKSTSYVEYIRIDKQ